MDHAEEAVGELVVAGGDGPVDLKVAEHALDAIALLVQRTVMLKAKALTRSPEGLRETLALLTLDTP